MKVQTSIAQPGVKFSTIPEGDCFLQNDALWLRLKNGGLGKPRAARFVDGFYQQFTGEERVVPAPNVVITAG